MNPNSSSPASGGRFLFLLGGGAMLALGILSIALPCVTTVVVAKLAGYLLLGSGVALLAVGIFGKTRKHRLLDIAAGVFRILLGLVFIGNLVKTVFVLTVFLAGLFAVEGMTGVLLAFHLRGKNPAWGWVLFNSVGSLALGLLIFSRFRSGNPWTIGLLFGINCLFLGLSHLMYGFGLKQAREA